MNYPYLSEVMTEILISRMIIATEHRTTNTPNEQLTAEPVNALVLERSSASMLLSNRPAWQDRRRRTISAMDLMTIVSQKSLS